ncbi:MAG: hypothetical protein QT00_C0001G0458 [archaeon GW2011_AR5]|nr:MAG: hypothetical protein QT00_C0001G0458 [archaeon GW2011_AR5]
MNSLARKSFVGSLYRLLTSCSQVKLMEDYSNPEQLRKLLELYWMSTEPVKRYSEAIGSGVPFEIRVNDVSRLRIARHSFELVRD